MSLLLASVLLLLQDEAAVKVLQKLEETVEKAPRLKLEFQKEGACTENGKVTVRWTEKGMLAVAGPKCHARSVLKTEREGKPEGSESRIISDGARIFLEHSTAKIREIEPKFFSVPRVQASLVRAGASDALLVGGSFGDLLNVGGGGPQPKEFFEVTELREGAPTARGKTLTFSYRYEMERFPETPRKFQKITLEYDPATWKLLSRESLLRFDGGETKTRETYDLAFDADLPDSLFKIPEDKK